MTDDAERWRRSTAADDHVESEERIQRLRTAWHEHRAEEGNAIVLHARRVIGGTAAGHWCEPDNEQREAASRFLLDVGST